MSKATIIFANCAAGAREESPDPYELAKFIGKKLINKDIYGEVIAVGLSEIISSQSDSKVYLDDLRDFDRGLSEVLNIKSNQEIKFSLINSSDYKSLEAKENKWLGSNSVTRITNEVNNKRRVDCHLGAILYLDYEVSSENILLRFSGKDSNFEDPLTFLGSRDTEPRGAIILNKINFNQNIFNLSFLHLETNSHDLRKASKEFINSTLGSQNRLIQLEKLCSNFSDDSPSIIIGDFNSRAGARELESISDKYSFEHIYPEGFELDKLNYEKTESELDLPYSHIEHGILIDHAFIKNFENLGKCTFRVLNLDNQEKGKRLSDHNPIALTIEFSN